MGRGVLINLCWEFSSSYTMTLIISRFKSTSLSAFTLSHFRATRQGLPQASTQLIDKLQSITQKHNNSPFVVVFLYFLSLPFRLQNISFCFHNSPFNIGADLSTESLPLLAELLFCFYPRGWSHKRNLFSPNYKPPAPVLLCYLFWLFMKYTPITTGCFIHDRFPNIRILTIFHSAPNVRSTMRDWRKTNPQTSFSE